MQKWSVRKLCLLQECDKILKAVISLQYVEIRELHPQFWPTVGNYSKVFIRSLGV